MSIEDLREMGYESEEEFIAELCGCDGTWTIEEFFDSYDPD